MGIFNQGFGCQCNQCEENVDDALGGRTKSQVRQYAILRGWLCLSATFWFCSPDCLQLWINERKEQPSWDVVISDAQLLLTATTNPDEGGDSNENDNP